jgi:hypothetical protein
MLKLRDLVSQFNVIIVKETLDTFSISDVFTAFIYLFHFAIRYQIKAIHYSFIYLFIYVLPGLTPKTVHFTQSDSYNKQ